MDPTDVSDSEVPMAPATRPASGVRHVLVSDLELIGSIGVYEHEKVYQQRVVISLDLEVCDGYDGRSDRLEDVYDYTRAISAAHRTLESRHFNLVETLAEEIATACLADPTVRSVRVRIDKPDILPACRAVGIEIVRQNS